MFLSPIIYSSSAGVYVKLSNKVMAAEFCFIGHICLKVFFFFGWVEKNISFSADIFCAS